MLGEKFVTNFWGQSREEYTRAVYHHQSRLGTSHGVEAASLVFRYRKQRQDPSPKTTTTKRSFYEETMYLSHYTYVL